MAKHQFRLEHHGSVVILYAETLSAEAWVEEHLPEDRQGWGRNGTVIEPRYVADIVDGIEAAGFVVAGA